MSENSFKLLVTALLVYNFYLSHQCKIRHNFKYFEQHIEICEKMPGIDTDPDRPDPDRHALDADSDPDLAN
jgi:hypothetical protein